MANGDVKQVVAKYLTLEKPGYALMLDAPWGSGKTHFIGKVTDHETNETRLYVSLFNVHTAEEFGWALVRALNLWTFAPEGLVKRVKTAGRGARIRWAGMSVDFSKINMVEFALEKLPNTLIFDDVERCGVERKQLWGLINGFVEHEGKRVILVCNSDKDEEIKQLVEIREKLVGQVVTIEPDIEAALTTVWVRLPDGPGRKFLQLRQDLIRQTFTDAKHNNLRLLLRALRDAVGLIDQIEPDMQAFDEPMERLVRTFLALHMAFHEGRISKEDLVSRGEVANFHPSGIKTKRLRKLAKDHPKAEISAAYNTILSTELGRKLIGDGYASEEAINGALRKTHQFRETESKPDWIRLWEWVDEDEAELGALEDRIAQQMQRFEITHPGEILQLYGSREFKGEYFDDFCPKNNAREFCRYIHELDNRDLLPARLPAATRDHEAYGFDAEFGRIIYEGRAFKPDLRARVLVKLLKQKMDAAYERALPDAAAQLFADLQNDPLKFREQLEAQAGLLNYFNAAVLHQLDVADVAGVLLRYFIEERDMTAVLVFDTIGNRTSPHRQGLAEEQDWIAALKQELERQAGEVSPICLAQMRLFIRRHMKAE